MKLERRKENRIVFSAPVRYKIFHPENLNREALGLDLDLKAGLQDLGGGGVHLASKKTFQPGEVLEVELEITPGEKVRSVAQVVWSRPSGDGEFHSGIRFIPVYAEDLQKLEAYLQTRKG